ncbi:MAG: hypothetical protein J6S24_00265, partial [Lentisphaeria bacterium]|nr:hypothetical protein [Lentisphaeria bacterium]
QLLGDLVERINGDVNGEYTSVVCDSRRCVGGSVFVAVKGAVCDGHDL